MLHALMAGQSPDKLRESIFSAGNPTPLTGIASKDAPTAFSALAGLINIYNAADPNGVDTTRYVEVIPICIFLRATAANTSGTSFNLVGYLDDINRYSSGGTALVETSLYMTSRSGWTQRTAKAAVHFGELTLAAAGTNVKKVFNQQVADVIFAADDVLAIWFGAGTMEQGASHYNAILPPVRLGPGANLSIHELSPSASADPGFEVDIWWAEQGHPALIAA